MKHPNGVTVTGVDFNREGGEIAVEICITEQCARSGRTGWICLIRDSHDTLGAQHMFRGSNAWLHDTLEVLFDFDNDAYKMWINEMWQTLKSLR